MKRNKRKIIINLLIAMSVISISINAYAHSGRTDANGGHRDNKNKSGLGSYHYHCGGYPAHLHTNGVCPYSSSSKSNKNSSSSSSNSNSNTKTTTTKPTTVAVTGIQINENIETLEVGNNKILTATITPDNATDKSITWKSSDESIATISTTGELIAKKPGIVDITVASSNGETSSIKINIKETPKTNNMITKTSTNVQNNIISNTSTKNKEDSNPIGGVLVLGILVGGGYAGYKHYKNKKK